MKSGFIAENKILTKQGEFDRVIAEVNDINKLKLIASATEMLDILETISTMYSGSLEETTISERIVKSMCDDVIKKLK